MMLLVQRQTRRIHIPVGYTLFLYIAFCSTSVSGQVIVDGQHFRDSLYRHIGMEGSVMLSCQFAYAQGSSVIHVDLGNNASELNKLDAFIRSALTHPDLSIERIRLTGYSSIEGNYNINEQLSRERVHSFYHYLREHYPALYRYPHDLAWVAEDWDGLSKLVRSSALAERYEVLEIIRKNTSFDMREELLVKLNGGPAYAKMEQAIFPKLRRVEIKVEYSTKPGSGTLPPEPQPSLKEREFGDSGDNGVSQNVGSSSKAIKNTNIDIENWLGIGGAKQRNLEDYDNTNYNDYKEYKHKPIKSAVTYTSRRNNPHGQSSLSFGEGWGEGSEALHPGSMQKDDYRFALKTNALLWSGVQSDFKHTAPVANVALEYYINRNWSVEAGAMYSYWNYNHNIEFQGLSGYYVEPRFRVPIINNILEAFVGVYGRVGDYDQRKRSLTPRTYSLTPALSQGEGARKVTTASYTGKYYDMGLSAGLSIQLVGGFGIELGARAGYVKTKAAMYTHENGENWFDKYKHYGKVRVTDLNVSLVYRFR